MVLKIILECTYLSHLSIDFNKRNLNNILKLLEYKDIIELMYIDVYKKCWYLLLADFMVDYKE